MAVANELERKVKPSTHANGQANGQPQGGEVERERLRMMLLIRRFEERTAKEYAEPRALPDGSKEMKIGGFCHLYSGQEAIAVGIAAVFKKGLDALINGYRCHGHSLALGMKPRDAMAELFGRATGCSKGKGGSMHFFDAAVGNHGGHGIVGGHIPVGLGLAFAQKYKKNGGVTYCLFGDGAINQGTFNEAFNMASLLKVPAIFMVENNGVAMGTQVERHSAERDLAKRGLGFNMPCENVDGNDVDTVIAAMLKAGDRARRGEGPTFYSVNTYRFRGHSMSDPLKYRKDAEGKWLPEVEQAKSRDPIALYGAKLRNKGLVTEQQIEAMEAEVAAEVEQAIQQAEADPNPGLNERFDDILAENYPYQPK
ncbi:MAG TPA: thiamine pyrophosphate-dependent enzyme [Humisphaera sp.]